RLDRINSAIKILSDKSDIDSYVANDYQKYFWGTEYKDHGNPIHVKLRIANETSNILEKIKQDTALRFQTSSLYQDGEFYYYEDDILGMQDFRRWLRSYGASIAVLEPNELIEEIVSSANLALAYYKLLNK
ncbi:MAG: WYL domain-containing protein, partial [Suipraeoptans sp.]